MGFFKSLVSGLEVVAGAALIATGAGALAGAALITEGIASSGLIGGSIGKFLNSGVGQGLIAAVGLGGTAFAMFGQDALQTSLGAMNEEVAKDVSSLGANATAQTAGQISQDVSASMAAGTQDLVNTGSALLNSAGVPASALPSAASAAANGTTPEALQANISASGSQQAALEQTQNDVNAVQTGGGAVRGPGSGPGMGGPTQLSQPAGQGAMGASAPAGGTPDVNTGTVPPESTGPTPGTPGTPPPAGGGMLSKIGGLLDTKGGAAAVQGVGSMLGGVGQGLMQKQATQDMINAQQWADRTSSDPTLRSQLWSATSQPITVPQGYLQRAQALRTMLQQGGTAGVQPASGGPVPVLGMNSTPRGGMPGG